MLRWEFYYLFVYERYGEQSGVLEMYEMPIEVKANEQTDLLFENYCHLYPQLSLPYSSAEDFNAHPAYRDYAIRYKQMLPYEKMQLQGLVWIITSYFMKHAHLRVTHTDERIIKAMTFVKKNLHRVITLDELSAATCSSKANLGKIFNKVFGISPMHYVMQCRIQYAQMLLMTTEQSVQEVAKAVGCSDVSYFIRIFKRQLGFTPQEYREQLKY